jgi:hypothetical protein
VPKRSPAARASSDRLPAGEVSHGNGKLIRRNCGVVTAVTMADGSRLEFER